MHTIFSLFLCEFFSSIESDASEHNELCTVCNKDGTLILCEDCPRGFHVECVYPPIKKIPRGMWTCQICRGADQDLPLRKRALTIENQRGLFANKHVENFLKHILN